MKTLIGGAAAAVVGIIGLSIWFKEFLQILAGAIPVMLLLGGALAIYLGFDELKDTWKKEGTQDDTTFQSVDTEESEKIKQELDDLKKQNEELKKQNEELKSEDK